MQRNAWLFAVAVMVLGPLVLQAIGCQAEIDAPPSSNQGKGGTGTPSDGFGGSGPSLGGGSSVSGGNNGGGNSGTPVAGTGGSASPGTGGGPSVSSDAGSGSCSGGLLSC